ncbi:MAG: hypothetical protein CME20_20620 [Gemmatimonadetes bacterium]|nr:hypothetical protein [Gemmatimonadota bacterium]
MGRNSLGMLKRRVDGPNEDIPYAHSRPTFRRALRIAIRQGAVLVRSFGTTAIYSRKMWG